VSKQKKLCIEGWRGINHSYALVNQYQLLELKKYNFSISHKDVDFYNKNWSYKVNSAGFSKKNQIILDSLKTYDPEIKYDVTYRISYPFNTSSSNSSKLFIFGTSEFQTIEEHFYKANSLKINSGINFITPSNWSKRGFLKYGINEEKITVIPHGFNNEIYKPISKNRKTFFRKKLNIKDHEFVILSLGSMTRNKGIDILLKAFFILHHKYPHIKLILKDSSNLYNIKGVDSVRRELVSFKQFVTEDALNSIVFLSNNLDLSELNSLYSCSNCYVSPYRAEGFNIPPLEAAASGTPVIVTKGGATDDYFHKSFGLQIEASLKSSKAKTWLEPELESLISNLENIITGNANNLDTEFARNYLIEKFTWRAVTKKLVRKILES